MEEKSELIIYLIVRKGLNDYNLMSNTDKNRWTIFPPNQDLTIIGSKSHLL